MNERVRYTIAAVTALPDLELLRRDRAVPPSERTDRYLALPELDDRVRTLAQAIVRGKTTDADRAQAIEDYLRLNGRYTDTPPPVSSQDGRAPVEEFILGGLAGHCEYFASAMVVMARAVGLPSRLVNGFAGGRENPLGGFVELVGADAHAWVEVHYESAGWVRYDPTPPALRLRTAGAWSVMDRLADLASTVELWWFQRIVDFDSSDQIATLRAAFGAWRLLHQSHPESASGPADRLQTTPRHVLGLSASQLLLILVLAALLTILLRRHGRHTAQPPLPTAYKRALRLLARRGLARGTSTAAREFAREVEAAVPPAAGQAFARITEAYLRQRFGASTPPESTRDTQVLRYWLRRYRSLPE